MKLLKPDYVFEASWEVCHKMGGIHTVLSTHAKTLQKLFPDKVVFVGPYFEDAAPDGSFVDDEGLFSSWRLHAAEIEGLNVRVGRWNVPGSPIAMLVDFNPFFARKNEWYGKMWEWFGVDSLHAYGDYDEASMFSLAAAKAVESFFHYEMKSKGDIVYQAHEWMTGMGALYLQHQLPQVATVFTTHATSIGRSIAGNMKPLYDYMPGYHGDQMARELNMEAKHSIEKQTAHHVDCFTTVSEITNRECRQLLEREADVVLPNGFENDFVPKGRVYTQKRTKARSRMLAVANALMGTRLDDSTLIVGTSGRYEFKNKGQDVFLEAMGQLRGDDRLKRDVLAFVAVPAWSGSARQDVVQRLGSGEAGDFPLECPVLTHWLYNMDNDRALGMMRHLGIANQRGSRVYVVFVPCYLDGQDGVLNLSYYDWIEGCDLCVFPSYYEPWGYTPLESIAFKVPAVTTDLAGFGRWVNDTCGHEAELADGAKVIHRTDGNYWQVVEDVRNVIVQFAGFNKVQVKEVGKASAALAEKALWKHFIKNYLTAYDFALKRRNERMSNVEGRIKIE